MRSPKVAVLALAAVTPLTAQAMAHRPYPGDVAPASLVDVAVEVEGAERPLYAAPDGSGRLYFEARRGARYAIRLTNRSHERLGVVVEVDGLNVISVSTFKCRNRKISRPRRSSVDTASIS